MNDGGDPHRVLARNAACHQCRRRKLKCDAIRPTCGNCRKPRQRGPEKYEPPEACTWDEARDPSARTLRKREAKAARGVGHHKPPTSTPPLWANPNANGGPVPPPAGPSTLPLHHHHGIHNQPPAPQYLDPHAPPPVKVESYPEHMHNGYTNSAHAPPMPSSMPPMRQQHMSGPPISGHNGSPQHQASHPPQAPPPQHAPQNYSTNVRWVDEPQVPQTSPVDPMNNGGVGYSQQQQYPAPATGSAPAPAIASGSSFHVPDAPSNLNPNVSQVMYSDWPMDLPSAEITHHIADVFFARVRLVPKMIHRSTFLANLALPPNHHNFPALALIHGILALTAPYIAPQLLATRDYFPIGTSSNAVVHPEYDFTPRSTLIPSSTVSFTPTSIGDGSPLHRFQMWHRRKCYECLSQLVTNGTRLLESVQSMVCATWVDMMNGWWSDVWVEAGNAMRMSLPLNLNLSSKAMHDPLSHNIGSVLREATSDLEQAQRDRIWWLVFLTERFSAVGSLWPTSLADDEITTELPVSQAMFDSGVGDLIGVQTFQSPNFYSYHPPQHQDSLSLLVKVMRAFTDTLTFMRKYSRGLHSYQRYFTDAQFQQAFTNINTLRQNLPDEFRTSHTQTLHGQIVDPDKFTVINLLHGAFLTIGGPLITHHTWALPAARMILNEIRGVVSNYLNLAQTSFDITQLTSVNAYVWYLAARSLIRFIAAASASNSPQAQVEIAAFEADLQQLMGALTRLGERYPVALRYGKVLEGHRAQKIEPIGEIIVLNRDKNIFDSEYGGNIPRKTPSSSSATMSPTTLHEMTPAPTSGGGSNSNDVSPPQHSGVSPAINTMPNMQMSQQQQHPSIPLYYPQQPEDGKNAAQWFKTDFDIQSYSFDVEAMAQLVANHGPNGPNMQFDGAALAFHPQ